jgi:hypothetical protein
LCSRTNKGGKEKIKREKKKPTSSRSSPESAPEENPSTSIEAFFLP